MRQSLAVLILALVCPPLASAGDEPLTFAELLQVRTIQGPVLAEDGSWAAWEEVPDRGDGQVVARATTTDLEHRLPLGAAPRVNRDGRFVAAVLQPSFVERESADEEDAPKPGLVLLTTATGEVTHWKRVQGFAFTGGGRWLVMLHHEEDEEGDGEPAPSGEEEPVSGEPEAVAPSEGEREIAEVGEPGEGETEEMEPAETRPEAAVGEAMEPAAEADDEVEPRVGTVLRLVELATGEELEIPDVESFAVSGTGEWVAWAVAREDGANRAVVRDLATGRDLEVVAMERGRFTHLTWAEAAPKLALVAAADDAEGEPGDGAVWAWSASGEPIEVTSSGVPDGWWVPSANRLTWTRAGDRLFLGLKPESERVETPSEDDETPPDPTDLEALLAEVTLDVWHTDDPLIKTNARNEWEEEDRDRVYVAVWHAAGGRLVPLADPDLREIVLSEAPAGLVGTSPTPYLRERTWDGWYSDLYWVSQQDGRRVLLARHLADDHRASVSPDGQRVAWYETPHWYLWEAETERVRNLTEGLAVRFADEEHDLPDPASAYGWTGWLDDGSALVVSDRWDLWALPVDGSVPRNLSRGWGREHRVSLTRVDLEPDSEWVPSQGPWLVEGVARDTRSDGFYALAPDTGRIRPLLVDDAARFRVLVQAKAADRLVFTRESYRTFPDLWAGERTFTRPRRLSDANPGLVERFAWGTAELIEWTSGDGESLEGVLIRPETLAAGERCPVLVYYYNRFFSERLHFFNEPVVNHRPSFPVYASHGYCVFLPDVRFEIGRPGASAVQALVPGVQKLVDLGIADPDAIGLHGHSWSGYQTAYVVTQTDRFAAAVAGAPVSNMTSAYGGIRIGTGLARQFQYEKAQSRLGASLWERRDLYIENSPLFYADRIHTPLLIQFGDEDEAVPWSEGVQLYLALRRLGKEAVLLQYRGEPHHLQEEANQLDYSIKMKEFFDHHLRGAPAPSWWAEGVPYRGD